VVKFLIPHKHSPTVRTVDINQILFTQSKLFSSMRCSTWWNKQN